MPIDPYAVLRALLRADAARSTPEQRDVKKPQPPQPAKKPGR
jgi:hypothetical protein